MFRKLLNHGANVNTTDDDCDTRREEFQIDAAESFIELINSSTNFGHLCAHHQDHETKFLLLPHMVFIPLAVGGRLLGVEQQAMCSR